MLKKIILWILVISCMSVIFFFSSQEATESRKTSSGFIATVIKFFDFNNSVTDSQIEQIKEHCTFIVRKGAHFSIYALLGMLLYALLVEYRVRNKKAVSLAIFISFLYACTDEFHQSFVNGRSGEIRDIFIDVMGALTGCIMITVIRKILRRNHNELYG